MKTIAVLCVTLVLCWLEVTIGPVRVMETGAVLQQCVQEVWFSCYELIVNCNAIRTCLVPCPMLNYTENANSHCSLRNNTIPVYEDSCNFTCKTGFELSGSESRICQSDGSWSGTMTVCTRGVLM